LQISEETYESIVGDQFAGNGDEIQVILSVDTIIEYV